MRLIDADELTKVMTEDWFLDILLTQDGKSDLRKKLVDVIDSVPLAYDVEKVTDGIKDYFKDKIEKGKDVDGWDICDFSADAIDIVRKGGVKDE